VRDCVRITRLTVIRLIEKMNAKGSPLRCSEV
jgi:hypothetical protein